MIKFENVEVVGLDHAIRGMRNPMNSWENSDSVWGCSDNPYSDSVCEGCENDLCAGFGAYRVGPKDLDLMTKLAKAGPVHAKYRRMIVVYVDITAPLYWWKEFDTYKVGTVANSCSTMHKIAEKEFTLDDFSHEHLFSEENLRYDDEPNSMKILRSIIDALNAYRISYIDEGDKSVWWQMIQLLPSSYNQKRTVMLNYEVLANIYKTRKDHKLDEWRKHGNDIVYITRMADLPNGAIKSYKTSVPNDYFGFCDWIETLPHSSIIIE